MARLKKNATNEEKRTRFLEELGETGNVTEAARQANTPRKTLYNWRKEFPSFAAEWKAAEELGTESLEDEATRRAKEGTLKPVYQGGKKVGVVREFSDTLMIFLLKGRRPNKFKDRLAHGGDETGTPIQLVRVPTRKATDGPVPPNE